MPKIVRALVALLAFWAIDALCIVPESGWYWNPGESGRGFNVEIQNNVIFISGFIYDSHGAAIWVVGSCTMSSDRLCASMDLFQTSGGQCIGCAYQGFPATAKFGTASINFTSETTATLTINGVALFLQRQQFAIDLTNVATPLLGEWAFVMGSEFFPVYFGERAMLATTQVTSAGLTAVGNRSGDPTRVAVGSFTPSGWAILIDSSTLYYEIFTFTFTGLNSINGDSAAFLKTSLPTSTLPFIANRVGSAAAAAGLPAPGLAPRAGSATNADAAMAARSGAQSSTDAGAVARLKAVARTLVPALLARPN